MEKDCKLSISKISIILPCYNVEEYLPEALDSLLEQTLREIEIIPVDDGSPDNCSGILKDYAKRDGRIRPIYQKNKGYGGAINAGLKKATGIYIAILEPDDFVNNTYYEALYNVAQRDDLDVCGVSSYCEIRDQIRPRLIQSWYSGKNELLSVSQINDYLASAMPGITLKIYRREFVIENRIYMDESISAYLDIYYVTLALLSQPRIKIIRGLGYYYRKGHIGQSTSNPKTFQNIIKLVDLTLQNAFSHGGDAKNIGLKRRFLSKGQRGSLVGSMVAHLVSYYKKALVNRLDDLANALLEKIIALTDNYDNLAINKPTLDFLKLKGVSLTPEKEVAHYVSRISDFRSQEMHNHRNSNSSFSELLMEVEFFAAFTSMLDDTKIAQEPTRRIILFLTNFPGCKSNVIVDFIKWYMLRNGGYTIEMMNRDGSKFVILNWHLYLHRNKKYINLIAESAALFSKCKDICSTIPKLANRLPDHLKEVGSDLRVASVVWEKLESNAVEFESYIQEKTIAVVGNAPNEIGKSLGAEIDKQDIVIRFNNYTVAAEHAVDYGRKESVWVVTPGFDTILFKSHLYQFDFIIFPMAGMFVNRDRLRLLYNLTVSGVKIFTFETFETRFSTDLMVPSVGIYILQFLSERKHLAKSIQLYGFSSMESDSENRHYFEGDPTKHENIWPHEWSREAMVIDNIKKSFQGK